MTPSQIQVSGGAWIEVEKPLSVKTSEPSLLVREYGKSKCATFGMMPRTPDEVKSLRASLTLGKHKEINNKCRRCWATESVEAAGRKHVNEVVVTACATTSLPSGHPRWKILQTSFEKKQNTSVSEANARTVLQSANTEFNRLEETRRTINANNTALRSGHRRREGANVDVRAKEVLVKENGGRDKAHAVMTKKKEVRKSRKWPLMGGRPRKASWVRQIDVSLNLGQQQKLVHTSSDQNA